MKQILVLLVALFGTFTAFVACDDDSNGKLDGLAKIYIYGKNSTNKYLHENADGSQRTLSIEEICKGDSVSITTHVRSTEASSSTICVITPVEEAPLWGAIDTVNMRLALNASDIQNLTDAAYYFDNSRKMFLQKFEANYTYTDTIAYMPSENRLAAYDKLIKLFSEEELNWTEIYRVFNEGFIFVPCTGAEYKELVEKGLD